MSKVLVDREEIEAVRNTLANGGGAVGVLRWAESILAQPAEAEGVEVVAYGMPNSAPGKAPRMMMVAIDIPGDDQYGGQLWEPLVRQSALSAVTAERDRLQQFEAAYNEWHDKTEWVQKTAKAHELGKHRADVLKERIDQLRAEVERYVPLHEAVQRAAGELPEGWAIQLYIERDGGGVELIGPDGTEDFATNNERLDYTVIDALEAAMAAKEA